MTADGWITVVVTLGIVLGMVFNVAGPDLIMVAALTILLAAGVVDAGEALGGFSNPAVLTVAALFVVAAGLRETGGLDFVARRVLGQPKNLAGAQLRLMLPIASMSAFLNNTPVVAMMVPIVSDWSRRAGIHVSKLMIPLSYAAILGGTCTLIGTSTNLVVVGLAADRFPETAIGMFEIAWLGLPVCAVGMLFIVLSSRWLLPQRQGVTAAFENPREYTVAMRVEGGSPVVGQTIEKAGLRHLPGLYLVQIARDGEEIVAVGPDVHLMADDVLLFAGVVESVVDIRKIRGLVPDTDQVEKLLEPTANRRLFEAVIGRQSPLIGKSIRESKFRTIYDAAIIAVHRRGERIQKKVGDIVLETGDTLLLETDTSFERKHRNDGTFALVSEVRGSAPPRHDRAWIATVILVAMVAVNAAGLLPLLTSALLATGAMLVTRCVTGPEARRALDLRVLATIAAAFGVAAALDGSGAAALVASAIVDLAMPLGPVGLLASFYVVTAGFATVVGNNAAAALMFPVAAAAADAAGMTVRPMLLVLMLAASASFATPISYQTNLMVLGPGGYRFTDFFRIGVPLQIVTGVVAVAVASYLWL
jgi:di/tricarboxylate transporter